MECTKLKKLNLSSFNTHNVSKMSRMFSKCKNLQEVNLSSFYTQNVTDIREIFTYSIHFQMSSSILLL